MPGSPSCAEMMLYRQWQDCYGSLCAATALSTAGSGPEGANRPTLRGKSAPMRSPAMAIDKVIAPMLRVPLFCGLKPLQLTEIARQAERMAFRRGSVITEAGTLGDGAYLIVSGDAVRVPELRSGSAGADRTRFAHRRTRHADRPCVWRHCCRARPRALPEDPARPALYEQMQADPALADHFSSALVARLTQCRAGDAQDRPIACGARRYNPWLTARSRRTPSPCLAKPALKSKSWPKRKAPNSGGGVGREKRVMRIVPGGKPALASDVFRLDGGHYR